MNTPSHFLMTAAIDKALPRVPIVRSAFLWGSIAPDVPLWLLSIGGVLYYHLWRGWSMAETFRKMFDELYFQNELWLASHNLLHSPVVLLMGLGITWRQRRNIGSRARWVFWFLVACLFHSAIDILTHVDDGPLLLFPLSWTLRFHSPVSYWDSRYYGDIFQQFELALNGALLAYLLGGRVCRLARRLRAQLRRT